MNFTSDPSTHRQCFNVSIIDDGVLEDTEGFSLNLTLNETFTIQRLNILINPDFSLVEIADEDGMTRKGQ